MPAIPPLGPAAASGGAAGTGGVVVDDAGTVPAEGVGGGPSCEAGTVRPTGARTPCSAAQLGGPPASPPPAPRSSRVSPLRPPPRLHALRSTHHRLHGLHTLLRDLLCDLGKRLQETGEAAGETLADPRCCLHKLGKL